MWAAGDYDGIVEHILGVGRELVSRVGVSTGDEVLDVACGTGNATIPAALAGAKATGLDLTPDLLEKARRRATAVGVDIDWDEGDVEALPYEDRRFDVVLSSFGCMFAPDHRQAAAEISRVLRPGGRLGIAAWTPDGGIGRFFATLSAFVPPPPPPGFQPPPLWGAREHVTQLLDGTGIELTFEQAAVEFRFASVGAAVDEYTAKFGPILMLRDTLDPERWHDAKAAVEALFRTLDRNADAEELVMHGEYLITLGTKADT